MRRLNKVYLTLSVLAVLFVFVGMTFGKEVNFPDPHLESDIRSAIGKIHGPILESDLKGLKSLSAVGGGRSRIEDLTGLEHCTNLIELNLSLNQISDISPLSNLINLQNLNLRENRISDISPLGNLTNLQVLNLRHNNISNISFLSNLTNLQELSLGHNQISDISSLSSLVNLQELSLRENQINDISSLSGLFNLQKLELSYNQISDIAPLNKLIDLQELYLLQNPISDLSPLTTLTNLHNLGLDHNQISNIGPLLKNKGLTKGDCIGLGLNPLSITSVNIYIPQLREKGIDVEYTTKVDYSDKGISNLTELGRYWGAGLTSLDLSGNEISDISLLSNLINLSWLDLSVNRISDVAPLSNLANLKSLNLSVNDITDITSLFNLIKSNLTNLEGLDLRGNQISDVSPLSNFDNTNLCIGLSGNEISDIEPLLTCRVHRIDLRHNPLSLTSRYIYIPQIEQHGVRILSDTDKVKGTIKVDKLIDSGIIGGDAKIPLSFIEKSTYTYTLKLTSGGITSWTYRGLNIVKAEVTGDAAKAGWRVDEQTDTLAGFDDEKVVKFINSSLMTPGSVSGFQITDEFKNDSSQPDAIHWTIGMGGEDFRCSGSIDVLLPVVNDINISPNPTTVGKVTINFSISAEPPEIPSVTIDGKKAKYDSVEQNQQKVKYTYIYKVTDEDKQGKNKIAIKVTDSYWRQFVDNSNTLIIDTFASPPKDLTVSFTPEENKGIVNLSWNAPERENVASYNIYRSTSNIETISDLTPIATDIKKTEYQDVLTSWKSYYYAVTTVDELGNESGLSNIAHIKDYFVSSPKNLTISLTPERDKGIVNLSWQAPENEIYDIVAYSIYRSTSTFEEISNLKPIATDVEKTEYQDFLQKSNDYYYAVIAIDEIGNESGISDVRHISYKRPEVFLSIEDKAYLGNTFTIELKTENMFDLYGFQFDLVFEPDLLKVKKVTEGTFLKQDEVDTFWQEPEIDNQKGAVRNASAIRLQKSGVDGNGVLTNVTFKAISPGTSTLKLENVKFTNPNAEPITIVKVEDSLTLTIIVPWDVRKDGIIDIFDLAFVGTHFGEEIPPGTEPNPDVNRDGVVNIFDLVLVGSHFGEEIAAPSIHNISLLQQIYDLLKTVPNPNQNLKLALIELERLLVPSETKLMQNYPNPFNPETWIPFQLSESANVFISIYDVSGQLVRKIALGNIPAGVYVSKDRAVYWNGRNDIGERVTSGIYFYHLKAGNYNATKRMLILK